MRVVRRLAVAVAGIGALALAVPAGAGAGGVATVGLSSLPDGTAPGQPWRVTLTILQHGRTPLDGLSPVVRVVGTDGTTRTFEARPAGATGRYRADVVFPTAGRWRYEIDDGFSQTHTFAPVRIGGDAEGVGATPAAPRPAPTPAAGGDGCDLWAALAAALAAGLAAAVLAAAVVAVARRRRGAPEPAAR